MRPVLCTVASPFFSRPRPLCAERATPDIERIGSDMAEGTSRRKKARGRRNERSKMETDRHKNGEGEKNRDWGEGTGSGESKKGYERRDVGTDICRGSRVERFPSRYSGVEERSFRFCLFSTWFASPFNV